jgi:hypothetical protein
MNDSDQRARRNSRIMGSDYDNYKLMSREDEEERYYARQQRENDRIDKEEYLADMKEDDALTNPKEKIEVKDSYDWRRPETEQEREEREWKEWFRRDEERHFNRQWT